MNNNVKIGFIGLGKMGSGMCHNLQQAGFDLTVYNRTVSKTEPFKNKGAKVANSIAELTKECDVIFTSLFDDASLLEICEREIFPALSQGKIHVGLTTVQPETANQLKLAHQKYGADYIAAPVVGRPDAAQVGKLITFLAGCPAAIEKALPLIEKYTVQQVNLGEQASMANVMKICVNYMAMSQLAMLGEVFTFAEKTGLAKPYILAITEQFFAGNETMRMYAEKIAKRDFDTVGFDLSAGLKDALIFDQAFISQGIQATAIAGAKAHLIAANANGLGNKDWSALTEITRLLAGLKAN